MAKYSGVGTQTVTDTTADTTLTIERGGGRIWVYDFTSGFDGTPADFAFVITAQRFGTTDDGTGTDLVPAPLDPADSAFAGIVKTNHTAEPTSYVSAKELFEVAVNQRATYRWVAAPGGEMIIADTANTGIGWFTIHASATPTHTLGVHFIE